MKYFLNAGNFIRWGMCTARMQKAWQVWNYGDGPALIVRKGSGWEE